MSTSRQAKNADIQQPFFAVHMPALFQIDEIAFTKQANSSYMKKAYRFIYSHVLR